MRCRSMVAFFAPGYACTEFQTNGKPGSRLRTMPLPDPTQLNKRTLAPSSATSRGEVESWYYAIGMWTGKEADRPSEHVGELHWRFRQLLRGLTKQLHLRLWLFHLSLDNLFSCG